MKYYWQTREHWQDRFEIRSEYSSIGAIWANRYGPHSCPALPQNLAVVLGLPDQGIIGLRGIWADGVVMIQPTAQLGPYTNQDLYGFYSKLSDPDFAVIMEWVRSGGKGEYPYLAKTVAKYEFELAALPLLEDLGKDVAALASDLVRSKMNSGSFRVKVTFELELLEPV